MNGYPPPTVYFYCNPDAPCKNEDLHIVYYTCLGDKYAVYVREGRLQEALNEMRALGCTVVSVTDTNSTEVK